jgi:predicted transcriptional regulator
MLERLLAEIHSGGPLEINSLAARLDASPAMVAALLEHLERLGYIQPYQDTCGDGCRGCSLSEMCSPGASPRKVRLWRSAE